MGPAQRAYAEVSCCIHARTVVRAPPPAPAATGTMILTVTRACNLRCSYCPTAKDGWPSLSISDVQAAVRLFVDRFGGGDIKIFGGEPLLVPEVVRAALEAARSEPAIRHVYLSTNGLGLNAAWLDYFRQYPKGILTISIDGAPEDHRRLRRVKNDGVADAYDHILTLLPALLRTPRVVVTQTLAPATAKNGYANFQHIRSLGFRRFNLLPGYYIPWKDDQLAHLEQAFQSIGDAFRSAWADGENLYLRNLFVSAPTPFFNTGFVVDSDRSIHPSNIGLSGALDDTRDQTCAGTLDDPPTPAHLELLTTQVNGLLQEQLSQRVWNDTLAVDASLTRLCRSLLRDYLHHRQRKRARFGAAK